MSQTYFDSFFDNPDFATMSDEDGVAAINANPTLYGWMTSLGITAWQLWQKFKEWMGLSPKPSNFSQFMRDWWVGLGHPFDWLVD